MTEPHFVTKMKWTRDKYGDHHATAENGTRYVIRRERLETAARELMWVTYKFVAGDRERRMRPVNTTLKQAQGQAEIDRYWDQQEDKEN